MRKTIKQLERELEYARKFEDLYREEKRKYDEKYGKEYLMIQRNEANLYNAKEDLMDIIKWLINPESTMPMIVKEGERPIDPREIPKFR